MFEKEVTARCGDKRLETWTKGGERSSITKQSFKHDKRRCWFKGLRLLDP